MDKSFVSAGVPTIAACMCIWMAGAAADEFIPSDLLEKVSANDALYSDLAVSVRVMRQPGEGAKGLKRVEGIKGLSFIPVLSGETITRHASQSGMYRVQLIADVPSIGGPTKKFEHVHPANYGVCFLRFSMGAVSSSSLARSRGDIHLFV